MNTLKSFEPDFMISISSFKLGLKRVVAFSVLAAYEVVLALIRILFLPRVGTISVLRPGGTMVKVNAAGVIFIDCTVVQSGRSVPNWPAATVTDNPLQLRLARYSLLVKQWPARRNASSPMSNFRAL